MQVSILQFFFIAMRYTFLHSLFFVACTVTLALSQTPNAYNEIGYFTDQDHQPIDGYVDMTYQPKTKEEYSMMLGEDYTPGYYYDLNGKKIEGTIRYSYSDGFIRFKSYANGEEKSEKIKPEMCLAYVIGRDSFVVIKDFTVERELLSVPIDKPEFAEVLATIGDLTFYQHTRTGVNVSKGSNELVYTFIVQRGKGPLVSFPRGFAKFKEVATPCFRKVTLLANGLDAGTMTHKDLPAMIHILQYHTLAANHTKIYYSLSWEELRDSSEQGYQYYAEISHVNFATWNMRYFLKDGTPLYNGSFISQFPQKAKAFDFSFEEITPSEKKNGLFTFYFPDGRIRKTVEYKNNEITGDVKTYWHNGQIHYVYQKKTPSTHEYSVVADLSGKNILDAEGSGTETLYDSLQKRTVTRTYNDKQLKDSYFTDTTGTKIYQYCKNHAFLADAEERGQIKFAKRFNYPKSALSKSAYGMVIVRILADREGNTIKTNLVKGFDAEGDKAVLGYCYMKYRGKAWIPVKVDKVAVPQEILLTFVVELEPFSRYSGSYHYNSPWSTRMMMAPPGLSIPLGPR